MEPGRPATYLAYARDTLDLLELHARLHGEGMTSSYRVMATLLRMLLCDTTRQHGRIVDISLAARLWPELRLLALEPGTGRVSFPPGGARLPRLAWLEQPFTAPGGVYLTLRQTIRLVCDRDGGAHVDPPAGQPLPDLAGPVAAIAAYVATEIKPLTLPLPLQPPAST